MCVTIKLSLHWYQFSTKVATIEIIPHSSANPSGRSEEGEVYKCSSNTKENVNSPPCILEMVEFLPAVVTRGVGLWDWPVARYMAITHKWHSFSSSHASRILSPSLTALKKYRPPSRSGEIIELTFGIDISLILFISYCN